MRSGFAAIVVLVILSGCMSLPQDEGGQAGGPMPPLEGTYSTTGGWGVVTLWQTDDGFEGTYTDTWQSETGDLKLWVENGQWVGEWEEVAIDRGGELYEITISEEGRRIEGLANVTRQGGHSTFEDSPFVWNRE